jgi:hypothetical protein
MSTRDLDAIKADLAALTQRRREVMSELRELAGELGQEGLRLAAFHDTQFASAVTEVEIEAQWTKRTRIALEHTSREAERREASLVLDLRDYLHGLGHVTKRLKIIPVGERNPVFTDLFDVTANLLVEAKGSATREAVRMSIGQLADYGRYVPDALRAILLPSRPNGDLEELGHSQGIAFICPFREGFQTSDIRVHRLLRAAGTKEAAPAQSA